MGKLKLHHWIFMSMGVGLAVGLALNYATQVPEGVDGAKALLDKDGDFVKTLVWWLDLIGKDVFVGSLKMIIAPLIFASIVSGITSLPSMSELGSIGWKTLVYYAGTTAIAVAIGLVAVLLISPGTKAASMTIRKDRMDEIAAHKAQFEAAHPGVDPQTKAGKVELLTYLAAKKGEDLDARGDEKWKRVQDAEGQTFGAVFKRDILKPILSNPIKALADNNSLAIIFFAALTGLACMAVGSHALSVVSFFQGLNEIMMKITMWVMSLAPLAIGCLIASLVGTLGVDVLKSLGWYCIVVIVGIIVHVVVLLVIVAVMGRMNPITFIKGFRNAWMIAFSTCSSAATLPVTMECVMDNLKVSPKVANFALPLGATCNMDGTALYEGVAVVFLLQIYGGLEDVPIVLNFATTFIIFITAMLASVGAAAVPSAGLVSMALVASAVGLPLYYIPLIFGVDHMLDQFRTSTNVLGDAVGAVVVNRLEEKRLGEAPAVS